MAAHSKQIPFSRPRLCMLYPLLFFELESRLEFPIDRFQTLRKIKILQFSRFQFVVHSRAFKKKKPSDWNLRLTCEVPWKSLFLLWIHSTAYHAGRLKRKFSRKFWSFSTANTFRIVIRPFLIDRRKNYMHKQCGSPDMPKKSVWTFHHSAFCSWAL